VFLAAAVWLAWPQTAGNRLKLQIRYATGALSDTDASREALPSPGIVARAGLASPTRSPWVVANGWRFLRNPSGRYRYEVPAGKGTLAAAEAFAYGADALLTIDTRDTASVGNIQTLLEGIPALNLPAIADLAVIDDGTPATGEVMNLLARRNLFYEVVKRSDARFRINVAVGTPAYPAEEAADPSAFALKIRRQLTDERRALRIYGSEVVIARLTGDATRVRLHLINYGGREVDALRVRLRGAYSVVAGYFSDFRDESLRDVAVLDGATEFSLPQFGVYAMIDLKGR
jgi:hypothetical protein